MERPNSLAAPDVMNKVETSDKQCDEDEFDHERPGRRPPPSRAHLGTVPAAIYAEGASGVVPVRAALGEGPAFARSAHSRWPN